MIVPPPLHTPAGGKLPSMPRAFLAVGYKSHCFECCSKTSDAEQSTRNCSKVPCDSGIYYFEHPQDGFGSWDVEALDTGHHVNSLLSADLIRNVFDGNGLRECSGWVSGNAFRVGKGHEDRVWAARRHQLGEFWTNATSVQY
ncbi:hypothetical protein ANO14919_099010 [Xylariales sp. No.14919]|nr:hypothetical protein ANO14919_099010 [Xylariales sp. No.14919]